MMVWRGAAVLGVLAFSFAGSVRGACGAENADRDALLAGVSSIAAPGVPGPLCVFGEKAFAVVGGGSDKKGREPVVGAARWGAGRVVAFGHPGYFGAEALAEADTGRLMVNAVRWAAGGAPAAAQAGPRVAVYGQAGLLAFLQKQGIKAEALDGPGWPAKLKDFKVLCLTPSSLSADADLAAITQFVTAGGGLVAAELGWGWLQLHPGKTLERDNTANRLLAPAGIIWADGTLSRTDDKGYAAKDPPGPLVHAARALDALVAQAAGKATLSPDDVKQAMAAVCLAARTLPAADTILLPRLRRVAEEQSAAAVPTPEKPLKSDKALTRLALTIQLNDMAALPPEKIKAHPAAAVFPGAVPADAPRVERTMEVDTAVRDWHSTGLYAAPGEVVTVTVPEADAGKGLRVRIGAHSDRLWGLSTWQRAPEVCTETLLAAPVTRIAGAFGGLIYIDVHGRGKSGKVAVKIAGAVEAPYFVLGKTTVKEWQEKVRQNPAPWAELATDKVILTVPSKAVRGLNDPDDLMKFWDRVMDAAANLATIPTARPRPERYVTDIQIGAGYMHSGYPIMTLLDMPDIVVSKDRMMANGHGGVWGLFHELGHNHQVGDWTFEGTGEVTENLFTLYIFDTVCARPKGAFDRIAGDARTRMMKSYFTGGKPDFEKWKQDPFLALVMYVQVQEAFDWDAFKKTFAEYRGLAASDRPKSDAEKRDQWLVRLSRTVGRNLGPFFEVWGVPTSDKARASVADLPKWMPDGFPPG